MGTTREHPVPAHESDFMASVRVRPMTYGSSPRNRGTTVNYSQTVCFPKGHCVNFFKGKGKNYWQSRIPLHAGSFVS